MRSGILFAGLASISTVTGFLVWQTSVSSQPLPASPLAHDPGVRVGAGAGAPLANLSGSELALFNAGKLDFDETETPAEGLGPRMNLDSCGGCHSQPATGGTSPAVNPQVAFANSNGATNTIPSFITENGPVREVRFIKNPDGSADGGVHSLFTIAGYADAPGCNIQQDDFEGQHARHNAIFRIPTPVFGAGLIEQIPDSAILANHAANAGQKHALGIHGRANIVLAFNAVTGQLNKNGNDGTVARFGWKAQNKSLLMFSGEAYNVEMGITNELFQTERDEKAECQFAAVPNSVTNLGAATMAEGLSGIEKFAAFMRFLAPPVPSTDTPGGATSIANGKASFSTIGCALCHTPSMTTGNSAVPALRNQPVNLYSDLLVHDMGAQLADGIAQGQAGPREFRTPPLWGLGQRIYFLHDGRSSNLRETIIAHQSTTSAGGAPSEANAVVDNFNRLTEPQKQDVLNFLRSL